MKTSCLFHMVFLTIEILHQVVQDFIHSEKMSEGKSYNSWKIQALGPTNLPILDVGRVVICCHGLSPFPVPTEFLHF